MRVDRSIPSPARRCSYPGWQEADEEFCFATRDEEQAEVARQLGFNVI